MYRNLALAYAEAHADMASPTRPGCHTTSSDDSATFNFGRQGGVTNGAAWYSLKGGKSISQVLNSSNYLCVLGSTDLFLLKNVVTVFFLKNYYLSFVGNFV